MVTTEHVHRRVPALDHRGPLGLALRLGSSLDLVSIGASDAGSEIKVERERSEAEAGCTQLRAGDLTKGSTALASTFEARFIGTS
jgi:hypothetical protein